MKRPTGCAGGPRSSRPGGSVPALLLPTAGAAAVAPRAAVAATRVSAARTGRRHARTGSLRTTHAGAAHATARPHARAARTLWYDAILRGVCPLLLLLEFLIPGVLIDRQQPVAVEVHRVEHLDVFPGRPPLPQGDLTVLVGVVLDEERRRGLAPTS